VRNGSGFGEFGGKPAKQHRKQAEKTRRVKVKKLKIKHSRVAPLEPPRYIPSVVI
jgi:hypothetical protein